jgi:Fic family protein
VQGFDWYLNFKCSGIGMSRQPSILMLNPALLSQIDLLKARLDRLRPLPPELVDNLREVFDIRLTYHSNAIEGNTLTQSETQIVIEKGITIGGKPLKDHLEAINHIEAIDFIRDLAMEERTITEWDIRQIHGLVCKGERAAGAYRSVNVMAAGTNYRYPDAILVPELMQEFGAWLQSSSALHPVEIATEIHYRLVTIHPFQDGNGRTARLLMNLSLLGTGYPIAVIKTEDRSNYIDGIVAWQSDGDDSMLKQTIAKCVESSLVEILSFAEP